MPKKIVSFGFKHGWPPVDEPGSIVVDARLVFDNPYRNPALRLQTGLDLDVQRAVMQTEDFDFKFAYITEMAERTSGVVYIGCQGGRHRSVFLAERLGKDLDVPVEHRDLNRRDTLH